MEYRKRLGEFVVLKTKFFSKAETNSLLYVFTEHCTSQTILEYAKLLCKRLANRI